MNELATRGYNLTVLSCDTDQNAGPNLTYLHMPEVYHAIYDGHEQFSLNDLVDEPMVKSVIGYYDFEYSACGGAFKSQAFKELLNYPDGFKFDLVIFDFALGPCLLGFLDKFNYPPAVGVTAFNNPPFSQQVVGGHKYYAYIPHYGLSYSNEMNFQQRLVNTFIHGLDEMYIQRTL